MRVALFSVAVPCLFPLACSSPPGKLSGSEEETRGLRVFSSIGKESYVLDGYREADLLVHEGKGCLTHMWFGGDWRGYERTRVRVYVDGEASPSIDMELGLGHGYGFGEEFAPWVAHRMGKTGAPSGVYNTYRIPFGKCVRVTAQRPRDAEDRKPFWWIVRGVENLRAAVGGVRLPESARLRLHKLEGYTAKPLEEFTLCDVAGPGALWQVAIAARGERDSGSWTDLSYFEACVRAYFDGSPEPTILSSGLEDYFLGTYYFNRGRYHGSVAGLTHLDPKARTFSAYRLHEDDPIFFQKGLRLTCRCGEELGGRPLHDPPPTTYTAYAWVYQW